MHALNGLITGLGALDQVGEGAFVLGHGVELLLNQGQVVGRGQL